MVAPAAPNVTSSVCRTRGRGLPVTRATTGIDAARSSAGRRLRAMSARGDRGRATCCRAFAARLGGDLGGGRGAAPGHRPRGCRYGRIDDHGHEYRTPQAQQANQQEAGDQCAERGAPGVGRVEGGEVDPGLLPIPHQGAAQDGEGGAHQRGGDQQHQERDREARGDEAGAAVAQGAAQQRGHGAHPLHRHQRRQRGDGDSQLVTGVETQRPAAAVAAAAEQPAAQREAAHEGGQHGRGRRHGGAEHGGQQPEPHHLVDQPARPRKQKQRQDGGAPAAHG